LVNEDACEIGPARECANLLDGAILFLDVGLAAIGDIGVRRRVCSVQLRVPAQGFGNGLGLTHFGTLAPNPASRIVDLGLGADTRPPSCRGDARTLMASIGGQILRRRRRDFLEVLPDLRRHVSHVRTPRTSINEIYANAHQYNFRLEDSACLEPREE
jgi:hypothetical protein